MGVSLASKPTMEERLSTKLWQGRQFEMCALNLCNRVAGRFPSRYSEESFHTSVQSMSLVPNNLNLNNLSKTNTSCSPRVILNQLLHESNTSLAVC